MGSKVEFEVENEIGTEVEFEIGSETEVEFEIGSGTEVEFEIGTATESDSELEAEAETKTKTSNDSGAKAKKYQENILTQDIGELIQNDKIAKLGKLGRKQLTVLIIFILVLVVVLDIVTYVVYRKKQENRYYSSGLKLCKETAKIVDGDEVEEYYNNLKKDPEYYKKNEVSDSFLETLEYMKNVNTSVLNLEFLSVFVPEKDQIVYIYDVEYGVDCIGFAEKYKTEMSQEIIKDVYRKKPILGKPYIYPAEEYGTIFATYYPVKNSKGEPVALVEASYAIKQIDLDIQQFQLIMIIPFFLVFLVGIFIFVAFMYRSMIKPIWILNHSVKNIIANLDEKDFHIDVHTHDELEDLARNFEYMKEELVEYIDVSAKLGSEKKIMENELGLATKIQADMLPKNFDSVHEQNECLTVFGSMEPAKQVGGDFYDYFFVDEDHFAFVIGDVSGKGVPAALFMVRSMMAIRHNVMQGFDLGEVFSRSNNELCEGNEADLFTTAWLGVYEISTGRLQYVDAGHENPLHGKVDGSISFIAPNSKKTPLGFFPDVEYEQCETQLSDGDMIALFTDGVPEANDTNKEFYGHERLEAVAKDNDAIKTSNVEGFLKALRKDIGVFVGDAEQFDDLTMFGITVKRK